MPTDHTPTDERLAYVTECADDGKVYDEDARDVAAWLRELQVLRKAWSVCYEMFGPFDRGNMYDALEDAQKEFADAD